MSLRRMELILDDDDFDTIQAEITRRQVAHRWPEGGTILPEGESNLAGAIIAEMVRDLDEYRSLFDSEFPRSEGAGE
jgi:hypothetical protein